MSLIVGNKSTDSLIRYGNGKKVGEVRQWLNKEQAELEGQHMVIVIDYILLHYMLT
jgi:hypothetical protein